MKRYKKLKLRIEMVPLTSWRDNLRKRISKKKWDQIREKTIKRYKYKCGICESRGRLSCHEVWSYDDKKHIQKLSGFIPLCNGCHLLKHIGMTGILASQDKLDYEKIVKHFMKVNKCDKETFEDHKEKASTQWRERSRHSWKIDLGRYKNLVSCSGL